MNIHYEYEPLFLKDELVRVSKFVCHNSYGRIHWHEPIEILFFTNGNAITACNFKEYSVKKGSILLINGNECHTGIISQENSTFYCIHFSPTFLHNLIGNEYVIFDNLIEDENCTKLLNLIVELSEKEKNTKNLLEIRKLSYEFFIILTNHYIKEISGEENYKKQFKKLDTFHNIINYLETHYFEDLQIEELSKIFNMSPSYFAHFFKDYSQKSVIKYINELRINRAKNYLDKEDLSISEIALKVGFSDINYFSRKFKQITGISPTQYKKN